MKSRRWQALEAIEVVNLPDGWGALQPHRAWERWAHYRDAWDDSCAAPIRSLHLQALGGINAGYIQVSSGGCDIRTDIEHFQAAVDHALEWWKKAGY